MVTGPLQVGDRVIFWEKRHGKWPMGTITKIDDDAWFFPYWVKWDEPDSVQCEGAFQITCFNWKEMRKRGMLKWS